MKVCQPFSVRQGLLLQRIVPQARPPGRGRFCRLREFEGFLEVGPERRNQHVGFCYDDALSRDPNTRSNDRKHTLAAKSAM
jgi:hypothetical protein